MKMRQFKNKFNLVLTAMTVVALVFASSCGSDDPVAPAITVGFSSGNGAIAENSSDPLTVTVTYSGIPSVAGSATITTSGTATYGTDYTTDPLATSGAITVDVVSGNATATFTMSAINNNASDGDRTAIFTLSSATGIDLGAENLSVTITITDDDVPGASSIIEDFEMSTQADNDNFEMMSWINHAEAGSELYTFQEFGGNKFVEFSSFSTGEDSNIGWLVLPRVNFDGFAVSEMSFWNQIGFGDTNTLFELFYSNDFDGSSTGITTATWNALTFNISTNDNEWVSSGAIDLSTISGNGYLAFRYTGNTNADNDASYRIDNIIIGEATPSVTVTQSLGDFGSVDNGSSSAEQSFTLVGTGVSGDVTVSASAGFEVSLTTASGFASSVALTDVSTDQTVYVRFSPASGANGTINGSISIDAGSAIVSDINVTGTEQGNAATIGLLEENYDYGATAGDLTTVTTTWTNHSGTAPIGYATTSLSLTGYAASGTGGSATISDPGGSAEDANRTFAVQNSGVVYASALMSISSFEATGDDYFFHFKESPTLFGGWARLYAQDDGSGGLNFGISQTSSGSSTKVYSSSTYQYNTTYLVVLKYDFTAGSASLFVLDAVPATEPANADATSTDGTVSGGFEAISIRQGSDTPNGTIDGVIVTTDWADFSN